MAAQTRHLVESWEDFFVGEGRSVCHTYTQAQRGNESADGDYVAVCVRIWALSELVWSDRNAGTFLACLVGKEKGMYQTARQIIEV